MKGSRDDRLVALVGFLVATFAVTWTTWVLPALVVEPGNAVFAVGGPVFLVGVFAPAFVALAFTAYRDGREGVSRLLACILKWQVGARYYLFAVGYVVALEMLAALM